MPEGHRASGAAVLAGREAAVPVRLQLRFRRTYGGAGRPGREDPGRPAPHLGRPDRLRGPDRCRGRPQPGEGRPGRHRRGHRHRRDRAQRAPGGPAGRCTHRRRRRQQPGEGGGGPAVRRHALPDERGGRARHPARRDRPRLRVRRPHRADPPGDRPARPARTGRAAGRTGGERRGVVPGLLDVPGQVDPRLPLRLLAAAARHRPVRGPLPGGPAAAGRTGHRDLPGGGLRQGGRRRAPRAGRPGVLVF